MDEVPIDRGLYRVAYSERVRHAIGVLLRQAKVRGLERSVLDALGQIDHRLRVYPQFGQPLRDLKTVDEQIWIGAVPPLVVQCVIDEDKRLVMVVVPFLPLPKSGLEDDSAR